MARSKATESTIAQRTTRLLSSFDRCLEEGTKVFTGPSIHFHLRTVERRRELGSLEAAIKDPLYADYVYATVACWGMHRMGPKGAKMVPFEVFRESLLRNADKIQGLSSLLIQSIPEDRISTVVDELWKVIRGDDGIKVSASNSPLVAATKVLHHLIPGLVPPIDRTYTGEFFVWKNRMQGSPEEMFRDTFSRLIALAKQLESPARSYAGIGFNTALTKILDNAIVGFVRINRLSPDESSD